MTRHDINFNRRCGESVEISVLRGPGRTSEERRERLCHHYGLAERSLETFARGISGLSPMLMSMALTAP
eukprot:1141928-Amphidinium_carterae.1